LKSVVFKNYLHFDLALRALNYADNINEFRTMKNIIEENSLGLLKFITCGSVDDGKSTLIGRLLFDAGQVYEDHLDALDDASKKFGTTGENRDFALLSC